jgi:dTDP-4-dehydrorhamnose 3,5-epimerase
MMSEKGFSSIKLEKHETRDVSDNHTNGELTVIWRDWDKIINNPQMIYLNSVNPGEIKGPHIHKNRTSYFFCIHGKMVIVVQDKNGEYHEIESDSATPKLITVSNGIAAAIINPFNNITKIIVMADIAWKPNDNEMENVTFDEYDWKKWNLGVD